MLSNNLEFPLWSMFKILFLWHFGHLNIQISCFCCLMSTKCLIFRISDNLTWRLYPFVKHVKLRPQKLSVWGFFFKWFWNAFILYCDIEMPTYSCVKGKGKIKTWKKYVSGLNLRFLWASKILFISFHCLALLAIYTKYRSQQLAWLKLYWLRL